MELFRYFKNENLQLALYFRMKGQYRKAFFHLKKACDEDNDPHACFLLGRTYEVGGFGKYHDPALCIKYFRKSSQLGCMWAKAALSIPVENEDLFSSLIRVKVCSSKEILFKKCVKILEEEGNVLICSYVGVLKIQRFGRYIKDAQCLAWSFDQKDLSEARKQKSSNAIVDFAYEKLSQSDIYSFANLSIRATGFDFLDPNIGSYNNFKNDSRICHSIGYWLQKNNRYMWHPFGTDREYLVSNPLNFYRKNVSCIALSVLCAIWCLNHFVCKDIRCIIVKKVWKTRKDYELWIKPCLLLV